MSIDAGMVSVDVVVEPRSVYLEPLRDRVVIRRRGIGEVVKDGGFSTVRASGDSQLFIPADAKEMPNEGEVVAVGPGERTEGGVAIPMAVKVGDVVLFSRFAGSDVPIGEETFTILSEGDILGILRETQS